MLLKFCKDCGWGYPICYYEKYKNRKYYRSECRDCRAKEKRKWREKNKEKCKQSRRRLYLNNIDKEKEQNKKWKKDNPEKVKEMGKKRYEKNPDYNKQYYQKNPEYNKEKSAQWRQKNPEKVKKGREQWRQKNPEKKKEQDARWRLKNPHYGTNRCKTDIQFKIACNVRSRVRASVRNGSKAGSAVRDLGCSIEEFKQYIEKQFYDHPITGEKMTWENYGSLWQLDHIYPLSLADLTDRVQFLWVCHYTNIQPMWTEENLKKGNKIIIKG